jgi:hypothetical protein
MASDTCTLAASCLRLCAASHRARERAPLRDRWVPGGPLVGAVIRGAIRGAVALSAVGLSRRAPGDVVEYGCGRPQLLWRSTSNLRNPPYQCPICIRAVAVLCVPAGATQRAHGRPFCTIDSWEGSVWLRTWCSLFPSVANVQCAAVSLSVVSVVMIESALLRPQRASERLVCAVPRRVVPVPLCNVHVVREGWSIPRSGAPSNTPVVGSLSG